MEREQSHFNVSIHLFVSFSEDIGRVCRQMHGEIKIAAARFQTQSYLSNLISKNFCLIHICLIHIYTHLILFTIHKSLMTEIYKARNLFVIVRQIAIFSHTNTVSRAISRTLPI